MGLERGHEFLDDSLIDFRFTARREALFQVGHPDEQRGLDLWLASKPEDGVQAAPCPISDWRNRIIDSIGHMIGRPIRRVQSLVLSFQP